VEYFSTTGVYNMGNTYISMREFEKDQLEQYMNERYGDSSRITKGAAISELAKEALNDE